MRKVRCVATVTWRSIIEEKNRFCHLLQYRNTPPAARGQPWKVMSCIISLVGKRLKRKEIRRDKKFGSFLELRKRVLGVEQDDGSRG